MRVVDELVEDNCVDVKFIVAINPKEKPETLDRDLGKVLALGKRQSRAGTPKRDAFEKSIPCS